MKYEDALEYINNTLRFGSRPGLERIRILLEKLGNPHKKLKFFHVAGTNGKGSVAAFLSYGLIEAGYKTATFTSPYIDKFNERIKINFKDITDNDIVFLLKKIKPAVEEMISEGTEHPTEFELVTAMAFLHYFYKNVDYVVLEVGLGGRYDATNIIENPLYCVMTRIGMDH